MKNYLALLILKIVAYFPIGASRGLGKLLGRSLYSLNSRSAQTCKKNLTLCYPELNAQEINRLCFDRMQHLGQSLFETPKIWRKGSIWVESKVKKVYGLDIFESLFEQKKGHPRTGENCRPEAALTCEISWNKGCWWVFSSCSFRCTESCSSHSVLVTYV